MRLFTEGGSMVGQSIVFEAASGDEIRLYNFGGQIYEDSSNRWLPEIVPSYYPDQRTLSL